MGKDLPRKLAIETGQRTRQTHEYILRVAGYEYYSRFYFHAHISSRLDFGFPAKPSVNPKNLCE